jgi:hypothetical protein
LSKSIHNSQSKSVPVFSMCRNEKTTILSTLMLIAGRRMAFDFVGFWN